MLFLLEQMLWVWIWLPECYLCLNHHPQTHRCCVPHGIPHCATSEQGTSVTRNQECQGPKVIEFMGLAVLGTSSHWFYFSGGIQNDTVTIWLMSDPIYNGGPIDVNGAETSYC